MTETERAELLAAARQIEVQDVPVGRLFARLIALLHRHDAAPVAPETPIVSETQADVPAASQEG